MDPITTAIVAALPALASDLVKSAVKDAYEGLKAAIRAKWGHDGALTKAVDALEANPKSQAHEAALAQAATGVEVTASTEVTQALAKLVEELKREGVGGQAVADIKITMNGGIVQGVVGAKEVSVGTMTFGPPPGVAG
jgi:hypothetical protein